MNGCETQKSRNEWQRDLLDSVASDPNKMQNHGGVRYGCCPETQHNWVVVAETGGVRHVNIPTGIDNRRSRCLRVLAYERRAHPLAAWVVPLKLRPAGPYVAEPGDVLCKRMYIAQWRGRKGQVQPYLWGHTDLFLRLRWGTVLLIHR